MSRNGNGKKPVLITGGAGFIGTNLAHRLLSQNERVVLFDNLSRPGVRKNLDWLREQHGERVEWVPGDIRDAAAVRAAVRGAGRVFHFAAQVAVTTSLEDPIGDFETNARGTLNVLEAIRGMSVPPPLVFTSTNKVYGNLAGVTIGDQGLRCQPADEQIRAHGIGEERPVDFHSPYGCSKGAADQYVLDYARTFDLPAVVFRMSCIYGPHQFGNEDQGWVAHFLIRAIAGEPVTIYGTGRQVRDILFVEDLVEAFQLAQENIERLSGQAFNIGGGPENTVSLLELLRLIEATHGRRPEASFEDWRAADQWYYVSDTRKFARATGWRARVNVAEGVARLHRWLLENAGNAPLLDGRLAAVPDPEVAPQTAGIVAAPRSKRLRSAQARRKLMAA